MPLRAETRATDVKMNATSGGTEGGTEGEMDVITRATRAADRPPGRI
jgi:hypothetical protein